MSGLAELIPVASVVDWNALWETAVASVVAGVGITVAVSTAIFGFATFAEARRDERGGAAAASAMLAFAATAVFVAAIVFGLIVMING